MTAPAVRPARAAPRTLAADVVIVGSGAGGATVAARLAEGGARVVILEEGPRHAPPSAGARPPEMIASLYRDAGQILTIGHPPIVLPLGRGVGGTTLINSGTCFRTPPGVLDTWRAQGLARLASELPEHLQRVEEELGVSEVTPELAGRNAHIAHRAARALGWSGGYLRRNAVGCVASGVCAFGCPAGAKLHAGEVYVPRAERAGARLMTGTRARRILTRAGRAIGVEADGLLVRARTVVVAAGTIHTPALLARSGLGTGSGHLGRNLSLHPATAAWGVMDERVDLGRGVPQSYFVDEFAPEGIMLEGIAGPPDYVAMSLPFAGERHREVMLRYPYLAQFGVMISDRSRGRVTRLGIRYDLCEADRAALSKGRARVEELLRAGGAREVFHTPRLMAFHPLGTARAAADPRAGVVDEDLAVHETRGIHVADGSVVPTPLGVNPQITIMALASRLGEALCRF